VPDIAPFHGLRYDPARVGDLSLVVTPPYDVISPEARDAYHDRHPYSAIRLDLGKGPTEGTEETWYVQAGRTFAQWQRQGILVREPEPALYLYEQDFTLGRHRLSRRGVIALVHLEPYGQGGIFPHEHTFPRHRKDRLNLMRACPANLSHIFAIYGGPPDPIAGIQNEAMDGPPAVEAVDDEGFHHRLWVLADGAAIARLAAALRGRPVVIADGHHRYETALAYREECLALDPDGPDLRQGKTYNYTTMMLVNARDPGLVILPTHRLVRSIPHASTDRLLQDVRRLFAVEPRDLPAGAEVDGVRACLQEMARRGREEQVFGLYAGGKEFTLLTPKEAARSAAAAQADAATARVDTALLHAVLFRDVLGIPADREGAEVSYTQDEAAAFGRVATGAARLAVFLNPTPVEQVEAVAATGRRLPPKSTYFYPKLLTGLVFHRIALDEAAAHPAPA
jgi:uncharacterized protein (DUF1015 family)